MRNLRPAPICAFSVLVATGVVAVLVSRPEDWDRPAMLALLCLRARRGPLRDPDARPGIYVAGSMPVFVLAAVLWGPAPAAALGVTVALAQWRSRGTSARRRRRAGVLPAADRPCRRVARVPDPIHNWLLFMTVVGAAYMLAATLNFAMVAGYMRMLRGGSFSMNIAATWRPLVNTQLACALGTALLAYLYLRIGTTVVVFAGALVVMYSRLQRDLIEAERLRDEATERNEELAATNERLRRAHFGAMRSLVRSIHLHDRMTARHSAAVARYARGIARAAGCSEDDQQLVHTAGLLHDVGKHILDDAILKGDTKLDDEQWELVKRHPEEGARIVRLLEGQGPSRRSSTPTTSGSTAAATPAGSRARRSRCCRA